MIRRDFFKAIAAAGAALAAGRTATAALAAPVVDLRPKQAIGELIRPRQSSAEKYVRTLLNKCAVVSFNRTRVGGAWEWTVDYVYDEHGRYAVNLNNELASLMPAKAAAKSIEVVTERDSIPVHLGMHLPSQFMRIEEPRHRIIVTWVTP